MNGDEPIRGRNLLLSFDDGFISNRTVADTVLKPLGIHALFFVITDFIDLEDVESRREFIVRQLRPGTEPAIIPDHWKNMSWDDLGALLESGHTIGAHSRSHSRLSEMKDETGLIAEIIGSGERLEHDLGIRVQHFAFPFGNLASLSSTALAVAQRHFPFIHSGLRGDNATGASPWAVRRDSISPCDSFSRLGALLEGAVDFRYAGDAAKLAAWGVTELPDIKKDIIDICPIRGLGRPT